MGTYSRQWLFLCEWLIEDEGIEGPKVWEDLSEAMKGEISYKSDC